MDEQGRLSPGWVLAIYGSAAALAIAAAMHGLLNDNELWTLAGLVSMIVTLTTLPVCLSLRKPQSNEGNQSIELDRIRTKIRTLVEAMEKLNETIVLSDDARRVINRRKERDLLCKAIEEDIQNEDWSAGLVLVRELAERFGYRAEAEEFRSKIDAARANTQNRDVKAAIHALEGLIAAHKWEKALSEAARISRVYHDSPQVEGLRHRVITARDHYKYEIERRFLTAAQDDRVDEAMDLLREMDQYLTPDEGEQYQEVARGVIGKARDNLGAQFKMAVNDKAWARAASVGEQIIDEFPNSRMATEVRSMIDKVRDRAGVSRS